jgi:hypothetical protein
METLATSACDLGLAHGADVVDDLIRGAEREGGDGERWIHAERCRDDGCVRDVEIRIDAATRL